MRIEDYFLQPPNSEEQAHRAYDNLLDTIESIPVCEPIFVDDECIGSISRVGNKKFIVLMIIDGEEFAADFCTEEDFVRLDGYLVAYSDALRYIEHVDEFHEDQTFKFS